MNEKLRNTVKALKLLRQHRAHPAYDQLIDLLQEMQQDIRLLNDNEPDTTQLFRNQGGIHWLGEVVKSMKAQDREPAKVYDGGYTDI
jgi:hypothetical protein